MVMAEALWRNGFGVLRWHSIFSVFFFLTSPNHEMLPASQITVSHLLRL